MVLMTTAGPFESGCRLIVQYSEYGYEMQASIAVGSGGLSLLSLFTSHFRSGSGIIK